MLENGANFVAQIGDKIPQEIVATIVHWLLWFIVLFGIGIGAVVLLLIGIVKLFKAFLPVNLLLLLLLVQIIAMLARVGYKQYRKYY